MAFIHYKESLPVRVINLPYLQEALLLELNDQNKKTMISSLYCSPSQNSEEFESFLTNFEHLFSDINDRKPSDFVILGFFNTRSSDIDSAEGTKLFSLNIKWPTHIQTNNSFCIDSKNVDSQVLLLNDIISNIFRNILPNRYVTCDEQDPVWMNENIKWSIKAKNKLYLVYFKKGRQETDFCALEESVLHVI